MAGVRYPSTAGVEIPRQPRVRRHHNSRPADQHHRRADLRRSGGDGELLGPRIYHTGPGLFGPYVEEPFATLDDVCNALKRYSEFYKTNTIKQYMAGNRKQRQWVIMAAKE